MAQVLFFSFWIDDVGGVIFKLKMASFAIAIGLFIANADAQQLFKNETLGISATQPAGWFTVTDAQNRQNISKLKMNSAQFQEYVRKHARAPIFAITKHREPFGDLNPSLKITVRPLGRVTKKNLLAVANIVARTIAKNVGGASKIEQPKPIKVSGYSGAYTSVDYTLKTKSGLSFPTKSQMWLVVKDGLLVMIGAGTRIDEATGTRSEIQRIVNSIKLSSS